MSFTSGSRGVVRRPQVVHALTHGGRRRRVVPGELHSAVGSGTHMVTATYGGDAAHSASHRSTLTAVTTSPLPKVRIGSGKLMLRGGAVATRPGCPSGETFCDGTESIYTTQAFAASANKPRARPLLLGQARFHIPGGATQTVKIRVGKRAL